MDTYIELNQIISTKNISTVFQPIVCLSDGNIIGYEALSRGPKNSILQSPIKLFSAAEDYNMIWELELLCRTKALEKARFMEKNKFLFINVDPLIFRDEKFYKGFTIEYLKTHNISSSSIVFEITEHSAMDNYESFKRALVNYKSQGYKIAIDDMGVGYSCLEMLSETQPHFLKIDIGIIRNIDKNKFNQALVKSFATLAKTTNMKLIAEGIETEGELRTLIELDIYAGQGFFLQRPAGAFLNLSKNVITAIQKYNEFFNSKVNNRTKNLIGNISRIDKPFTKDTLCSEIKNFFSTNDCSGVCIIDDSIPVGLMMKNSLDSALATKYGVSIFSKRPISLIMDKHPLIVDYYSSVTNVSTAAMERPDGNTYDYIIVTKDSNYYGVVSVKRLLKTATKIETSYARALNPLSGLPGNVVIEDTLNNIILYDNNCCVLYFDLDNFKAYNDNYGFENGDKVLKFLSVLILEKINSIFPCNGFAGHIGGDDFICIIKSGLDECNKFSKEILLAFDKGIIDYFNEQDRNNGFFKSHDRKGNGAIFNLTSLSISGIFGNLSKFTDVAEVSKRVSEIKGKAKKVNKSNHIIEISE